MDKLGFVLYNYKAKLQVEIKSINRKIDAINKSKLLIKIKCLYLKYKLKKSLKIKKELLKFLDEYISNMKEDHLKIERVLTKEELIKIKNFNLIELKKYLKD